MRYFRFHTGFCRKYELAHLSWRLILDVLKRQKFGSLVYHTGMRGNCKWWMSSAVSSTCIMVHFICSISIPFLVFGQISQFNICLPSCVFWFEYFWWYKLYFRICTKKLFVSKLGFSSITEMLTDRIILEDSY